MTAAELVSDLSRVGIRLRWGKKGIHLHGDLSPLTPNYRAALASVREELEVLVRWQALQDELEARFGCPEARLYPFLRLELLKSPVIRTDQGPARLVRVVPGGCDVVFERELDEWERDCLVAERTLPFPPMTRLQLEQVYPPATPPEEVL